MSVKISIGWINNNGYSEDQIKTFADTDSAIAFCIKHKGRIARIGTNRIKRLDDPSQTDIELTEELATKYILDNAETTED